MLAFRCKALYIVINFSFLYFGPCVWVSPMSILKMPPSILQGELPRILSLYEISAAEKFSRLFEVLFTYFLVFIFTCLMVSISIFPNTCNFPFLQAFWFLPDFIPSIIYHFPLGTFFYARFHSYILAAYLIACIRVSNSFSFFANSLVFSLYIKWLIVTAN